MPKLIEIKGMKFGSLFVLERSHNPITKKSCWKCLCDCGKYTYTVGGHLIPGYTKSCGCKKKTHGVTHGLFNKNSYSTWIHMRGRCQNKNDGRYNSYGGRGIKVCNRWLKFENFYRDMGEKPKGMTLDRIDNNGNYEPRNCRWATPFEQQNNMRSNVILRHKGKEMTVANWSRLVGVSDTTLRTRIRRGWETSIALTKKTGIYNRNVHKGKK